MALTREDRWLLIRFARNPEFPPRPTSFIGRGEEFRLVAQRAEAALNGKPDQSAICMTGAPGVGKSAFLSELFRRSYPRHKPDRGWKADRDWGGPPMACLRIHTFTPHRPGIVLSSPPGPFPRDVSACIDPQLDSRMRDTFLFGKPLPPGFDEDPDDAMPWIGFTRMLKDVPPKLVFCLIADNAEKVKNTPGLPYNNILDTLLKGPPPDVPKIPFIMLIAGTPAVHDVLKRLPIMEGRRSFIKDIEHVRPPLSEYERILFVLSFLNSLAISKSDPARIALARRLANKRTGDVGCMERAMRAIGQKIIHAESLDEHEGFVRRLAQGAPLPEFQDDDADDQPEA